MNELQDAISWNYSSSGVMYFYGNEPPLVIHGNGPRWTEVVYIRIVAKR